MITSETSQTRICGLYIWEASTDKLEPESGKKKKLPHQLGIQLHHTRDKTISKKKDKETESQVEHTQESTMHKSSSTCVTAEHTSVTNQASAEHNERKTRMLYN